MAKITINEQEITVQDGITLIQACEQAGVEIPRFCYHERLAIAGNCRMCLVEVSPGPPKPVASCATNVADGMKISTNSPMVKKAREGVMEFLLANHPLDCPICDQAGECDLQDQSMAYGKTTSEFLEHKRSVKDKNLGPLVATQMTRCIHCTRCVRFITDVAGTAEMGAAGRGETMEITSYLEKNLTSELSGNIIDLCPVGALTSKPYAFKARSWELSKTESIDVMDAVGSNIRLDSRGLEVMRILPRLNEDINEEWISDKTRFCYDGLKVQRLDQAYIKENGKLKPASLAEAYKFIAQNIKGLKGEEIAALSGRLSSVEEVTALKILMEKLGSDNIDCREIDSSIDANDPASYIFNTTISGIDNADSCLIIGVNPRTVAPIINARIRKRFLSGKLKIAAIGVDADLTYKYDNLGNEVKILQDILDGTSSYNIK
jgi:NADH-quinone oxidoreductase subunit G